MGIIAGKPSRDLSRPLGRPRSLKGLLHMLNAIVLPQKRTYVSCFFILFCQGTSKMKVWGYLISAKYCIFDPP